LLELNVLCPVDYALNKFVLTKTNEGYLKVEYWYVGVKSSSQEKSKAISSIDYKEELEKTLEHLKGLVCGAKAFETDEIQAFRMRGFR